MSYIDLSLLVFVIVLLGISIYLLIRFRQVYSQSAQAARWQEINDHLTQSMKSEVREHRQEQYAQARDLRSELTQALAQFGQQQMQMFEAMNLRVDRTMQAQEERGSRLEDKMTGSLDKIWKHVDQRLQTLQEDNQRQLEKMRATVDEKLHQTLEERLGRSFKLVSEHLERVQHGLGEMKNLAAGVGDLKKVLANVKTRGILGEIQLINIIEQLMTTDQYDVNIPTVPGRDTRVEVAIRLPGRNRDEQPVYLPIDAKFPMDRYQQLSDAYEEGCPDKIRDTSRQLQRALLQAASDIQSKYVSPPHTTDFAIMFLPIEGLYAEVSRQPDLIHRLKNEHQILVAGPNNLSAFLSSLQMGFRTLAIEKRSSEVWTLLAEIKTEFGKFGQALDKVQKKLTEANNVIDQAGVRKRAVERRLNKVEELPSENQLNLNQVL